ncbi:MAG: c-type cytochrome, partial [Deltaproteobacteria bacterium]|nr:c-type cytochrome [Deltaproteobacteria bacterium]
MRRFVSVIAAALLLLVAAGTIKTAELKPPPSSPKLLALGKRIYGQQCAACHGPQGRGDGEAAYLLYPKPRNFVAANYRLVSTWDRIPTEQVKPPKSPAPDGSGGEGVIQLPKAPPFDAAAKARALELYKDACASCHGATGKGDGTQEQTDEEGFPTRPRDLTAGVFKGSPEPAQLYRRIVAGIPGSPMPMSDWAYGEDAWHLVNYVRALSSDRQRERVEMKKFEIVATRVKELPDHPDSGIWRLAPRVNLHLMPLWWRSDRPEEVTVRAVHDGKEIAFLLMWHDETHDHTAMRPQDFRDAVAVEFSLTRNPPFFAMGEKGK